MRRVAPSKFICGTGTRMGHVSSAVRAGTGTSSRFRDEEVDAARALDKVWDRTSAVVLLGQVGNGRVLVRISHANSPEKHLETWGSGQWSRMFVLGRESAFSQVIARQCAIGLIQRVRGHEQAEVVDTYPTPPKPISRTVQNGVDTYRGRRNDVRPLRRRTLRQPAYNRAGCSTA